jgi:hypothetical protein
MKRAWVSVSLAIAALAAFTAPALAAPPTRSEFDQNVSLTNATACGTYGVTWNINLHAVRWTFTDRQGRTVKWVEHITEDNTIVNTVTGLTLRDGPVDFVQTTTFDPETGQREHIFIVGTSVNVRRGRERLVDRGPILIDGQTGRILFAAGPHPIRELLDGSFNIRLALPGFCNILR